MYALFRYIAADGTIFKWTPLVYPSPAKKNVFHIPHHPTNYLHQKLFNLTQETTKHNEYSCSVYYSNILIDKYVMPNIYGNCHSSRTKLSLLIQMEDHETHLHKLELITKYWSSSISLVLYFPKTSQNVYYTKSYCTKRLENIFETYKLQNSSICVHAVISEKVGLSFL